MKARHGRRSALVLVPFVMLGMMISLGAANGRRAAAPPTVAELASELARAAGGGAPAGDLGERLLRRAGVAQTPNAALTEGAAAVMLRDLGIQAGTTRPASLVSREKMVALVRLAGEHAELRSPAVSSSRVSPATLDDCLALRNHGECVNCCRGEGLSSSACAKECFAINKPSPSEPLP